MAAEPKLPERLFVYFDSESEGNDAEGTIPMDGALADLIRVAGPAPSFVSAVPAPRRRRSRHMRLRTPVRAFPVFSYRFGRA